MSNKQSKKFRKMYRTRIDNIADTDVFQRTKKLTLSVARQRDIFIVISILLLVGLIFKFIF